MKTEQKKRQKKEVGASQEQSTSLNKILNDNNSIPQNVQNLTVKMFAEGEKYSIHEHYNETPEGVRDFIEQLPITVKEFILKVGDALEVPYEYPLLGLLACASTSIGRDLFIKKGQRKIFSNVYILLIGEQGLGKSPSAELPHAPLVHKDGKFLEQYQNDIEELQKQLDDAKNKEERRKIENQIKNLVMPKNVLDDETMENIPIRMLHTHKGLLWTTDEFASLVKKQFNGKSVTDFLIKAYSNKPWDIGRKTQENLHVPFTHLTLINTTQPDIAQKLLLTPELIANGFISRHLISVVLPDDEREPVLHPYELTEEDGESYDDFMLNLYERSKRVAGAVTLSPEAKEVLAQFKYFHKIKRQEESMSVFKGFHGKIEERILKVALNLHVLKCADQWTRENVEVGMISEDTIRASYGLVKHLTIDALEKLFATHSETEEDFIREAIIKMHKDNKTHIHYDEAEKDYKIYYVTVEELFYRVRRHYKQSRPMLREALGNRCPNIGVLKKHPTLNDKGRIYYPYVFFISTHIKEIYGTD